MSQQSARQLFSQLPRDWQLALKSFLESEAKFKIETNFFRALDKKEKIYPPWPDIFNAFRLTSFENTKVIILGQDPYHGPNQAHGLCFSVQRGVDIPPSLRNIYQELKTDLQCEVPHHGDLRMWAIQGVFLLNAILTVRAGDAASHQQFGWQEFTDNVIETLSKKHPRRLVFLLWGRYAKSKLPLIDSKRHLVLAAAHPSPLSAYNGFFGCRHFSKTNTFLVDHQMDPIDWQIVD